MKAPFALVRRLWETSTFDLATLATKHKLYVPYQLMDVFLSNCNLELQAEADSLDQAVENINALFLGFYLTGVSPSLVPFATSHSLNDYSGINSRDSEILKARLPEELQVGPSSNDIVVEAWPIQLSLHCKIRPTSLGITPTHFQSAADKARCWMGLESSQSVLKVVREATLAAPLLVSMDQSLLHIWCALEALFPSVSTEVSFRLALNLSQLISTPDQRETNFKRVRKAYSLRSKVAHGSSQGISLTEWESAWQLLCEAANAILARGGLPTEEDLLRELMQPGGDTMQPIDQREQR